MSDESEGPKAVVQISDIFGVGKLANSKAAERLVGAIVDGLGAGFRGWLGPWIIRRETEGRVSAAKTALMQIPRNVDLLINLEERAQIRVQRDVERAQLNREQIAALALSSAHIELSNEADEAVDCHSISLGWLDDFWRRAELVSDETTQKLWSKVLLREAQRPGHLSMRSLSILSTLSPLEAEMVENLAPFVVNFEREPMQKLAAGILTSIGQYQGTFSVPKNVSESFSKNVHRILPEFDVVALDAAGVMQSSNGWASDYYVTPKKDIHAVIGNSMFIFSDMPDPNERFSKHYYIGCGLGFTSEGCEIVRIVNAEPNRQYIQEIEGALRSAGCKLSRVVESK